MESAPLILFDGVCNLCAWSVRFIIARDPRARFRFAPLQSPLGQRLSTEYGFNAAALETVVLIEDGRVYTESDAALRIARALTWPWPMAALCRGVPRPVRDGLYGFVCRNRYRWFGKTEVCMVPSPALKARFRDV